MESEEEGRRKEVGEEDDNPTVVARSELVGGYAT